MKIYISGPMTGYENYNREQFDKVAQDLKLSGHVVLNPAVLPDGLTQSEYMDICCSMIRCADAIHLLIGWDKSLGATAEYALAEKIGKTVSFQKGALIPSGIYPR